MYNYSNYSYQVGGSLSFNHPTYINRRADKEFYESLRKGEYCYVLNSRQMGKSSLRVQTLRQLENEGFTCLDIDLSMLGSTGVTPKEWYGEIVTSLCQEHKFDFNPEKWWQTYPHRSPVSILNDFITNILLKEIRQDIIIFIDEIDSVLNLNFSFDDFFALIRYFYNQRAINPEFKRLTFALLGVATPSDLIQDRNQTPFNIGKSIDLQGFQLTEVQPLIQGIQKTVECPQVVMKEILWWTGGQPFLTQKLCKLVSQLNTYITVGDEEYQVKNLVESKIINDWEEKDSPQHFKTIENKIVGDIKNNISLLEHYKEILEKGAITTNDIDTETLLRLKIAGLVVKQQEKVKVYSEIYKIVFNDQWINKQLESIRPYAQSMRNWFTSNGKDKSKLLRGRALQEALQWKERKSLSNKDYQYLSASKNLKYKRIAISISTALIVPIISIASWQTYIITDKYNCSIGEKINGECSRIIISSGEKERLFFSKINYHLEEGTKAFSKGDYQQAIKLFENAKIADPIDPVLQIYLNNANARKQGNPLKVAVVISIDYYEETAKDILRGIADAQTEFNRKGKNSRLLEIVVANDGNDKAASKKIAEELADKTDILAVIGQHSSEGSLAALPIYEAEKIAMVSPSSSSSEIKGNIFYRTVSSTKEAGEISAQYVKKNLSSDKVAIFYAPESTYSNKAKKDFENAFKGKVVKSIDLSDLQLDINKEIQEIRQQNVKVVMLLPSIRTLSVAIAIAKENDKLPPSQKLQFFGGLALFQGGVLQQGGKAVDGIILASACLAEDSNYSNRAEKRWEQKDINWRTVTAYDAAQVLIKAIRLSSNEPTREEILKNLGSIKLSKEESSGFGLEWSREHSNIKRQYCLFQIRDNKFINIE